MRFLNPLISSMWRVPLAVVAASLLLIGCDDTTSIRDTKPEFSGAVANQTYTVAQAIPTLTLPEATGGNGSLTYSLDPTVPGLSFNAAARTLSGTPTKANTYEMTYSVADADDNTDAGDTDTLTFTIVVEEAPDTAPQFSGPINNLDRTYRVAQAIPTLPLPEATGGNGALIYSLAPTPPGLTFNATTRTLSGTPTDGGNLYDDVPGRGR